MVALWGEGGCRRTGPRARSPGIGALRRGSVALVVPLHRVFVHPEGSRTGLLYDVLLARNHVSRYIGRGLCLIGRRLLQLPFFPMDLFRRRGSGCRG